jgi:ligand-binding SRPBCC domain-containing protein
MRRRAVRGGCASSWVWVATYAACELCQVCRLRLHAVPIRWLTRIEVWEPGVRCEDVQLRGPYRLWHHIHTFEPDGHGALMRDVIRYALPLGPLGGLAHAPS